MMSGAPCPVELMKRVLEEMHCRELVIAYGQTETSPVVTMSDAADSLEIRVNTVGRAMPQTEIMIAPPEARATMAPMNRHARTPALRTAGRGMRARVRADEGLRRRSGGNGASDSAGRLAAHRRSGRDARGWMHPHHRPLTRRDYPRRREHLSARSGGVPLHASQGGRGAGDRDSQRATGRDCGGVDSLAAGLEQSKRRSRKSGPFARARSPITKFRSTCVSSRSFRPRCRARFRSTRCASSRLRRAGCRMWRRRRRRKDNCLPDRTPLECFAVLLRPARCATGILRLRSIPVLCDTRSARRCCWRRLWLLFPFVCRKS